MEVVLVHDAEESPLQRKSWLEMAGFEVTLLQSGRALLELLKVRQPTLVLMDVLIQGPNGFEVLHELRATHPPERVPVILGSHIYRPRPYRELALSLGAQGYVLLPVKRDDLLDEITSTLEGTTAAQEAA